MEGFGIEKLAFILVIVLVMFGARRVPEIGASFGKGIREFKRGLKDLGNDSSDSPAEPAALPRDNRQADSAGPAESADAPEPKRLFAAR